METHQVSYLLILQVTFLVGDPSKVMEVTRGHQQFFANNLRTK